MCKWAYNFFSKGHVALRVEGFQSNSAPYLIQCPRAFCKRRYDRLMSRELTRPLHWGVKQISGWEFLPVCYHICESGYMFLICHVTICLKTYATLWVGACCGMAPPFHVSGYWLHLSGYMKYFICHVTSQNHMMEGSSNFMCGNSSLYVTEI